MADEHTWNTLKRVTEERGENVMSQGNELAEGTMTQDIELHEEEQEVEDEKRKEQKVEVDSDISEEITKILLGGSRP